MSASVAGAWSRYLEHDLAGALDELLTVWADVRNAELADVIEALIASQPRDPLRGPTRKARRAEWVEIVEDNDPFDLPRLLDSLTTFLCGDATKLLEWLAGLRPNPVLASRLLALVLDPPENYQGQRQVKFWDRLMRVMDRSADPRGREPFVGVVDRLKQLEAQATEIDGRIHTALSAIQARLLPQLSAHLASLDGLKTALPREDLEACRRFAARLDAPDDLDAKHRAETLLQQVYASPADDELRLVLADALTEVGDDRGEFIVIQIRQANGDTLSRDMQRRQRELLTMYGRTWLGPIEPALQKSELVYRRGFPVKGRVQDYRVPKIEERLARPEWTTFEELDVSRLSNWTRLVVRRDMTALRRVWGVSEHVFDAEHELPLVQMSLRRRHATDFGKAARCRVLPHLRHLDVGRSDDLEPPRLRPLWDKGALGHRLETLTALDLRAWLIECRSNPPPVNRLIIGRSRPADWAGELRRDESGALSNLTLTPPRLSRVGRLDLARHLEGGLDHVRTVVITRSDRFTAAQRTSAEQFFERIPSVQSLDFVR